MIEVWTIHLLFLGLENTRAKIPPELALLTSLTYLVLEGNGLGLSLDEFSPDNMEDFEELRHLELGSKSVRRYFDDQTLSGTWLDRAAHFRIFSYWKHPDRNWPVL